MSAFDEELKSLNPRQREAVEAIDGPVMVIAGPGTGKTQILALRIANILAETDTPPSGILCLTFTNAGVHAMRSRLLRIIGPAAAEVHVSTFHRFALRLVETHYSLLDFESAPALLSETEAVALADELLQGGEWRHIRPRSDSAKYFSDLKSLISLGKRENMSPADFGQEIEGEIEAVRADPENISSRGPTKGKLKKEAEKEIEGLERTREAVAFYDQYEAAKRERGLMDYDDVLAHAVALARGSEDVRAAVRENYLYVLVDEHQDSSGIQNAFLDAVWGGTERPNVFAVGDDRQLIYGFGGASLEHFTGFARRFGAARQITLTKNYRSAQNILDAADALLQSSIASDKLESAGGEGKGDKIAVIECAYPRDEIIAAARRIKAAIVSGFRPEDCAILVPKNYQVRSAAEVLRDQGLPAAAGSAVSFFAAPETATVRAILGLLADPYDGAAAGALLLDPAFGIPPLEAHKFMRETGPRNLSLEALLSRGASQLGVDPVARLGARLADWLDSSQTLGIHGLIQKIGEILFFAEPGEHEALVRQAEVIRTFLHLVTAERERRPHETLADFLAYLDRLERYGHEIPLAVFSAERGVRVLTLHGSKGLEFPFVHVAHLDDGSLMRGKRLGFTLPERLRALAEAKSELDARRELYVAITRAKKYCSLSYARYSYSGAELEPARILADLPEALIERTSLAESEAAAAADPAAFVSRAAAEPLADPEKLAELVAGEYQNVKVSVTLLNNFFECPWKWYFRSLLQLPEAKTDSLLVGAAVHAGIEYMLKHRKAANEKNLDAALLECLEKEYVSDAAAMRRLMRDAKRTLDIFAREYLPAISPDAESERSLAYRDPALAHLTLYGKIDLTERDGGRASVTDFKTGSAKTRSAVEKRDEEGRMSALLRQLAMYSYLIRGAERGTEVEAARLLFIEARPGDPNAAYQTRITAEEIELLRKDIADYDRLVSGGGWISRECRAVLYGGGDQCEYCARAQKLYNLA